MMKTITCFRSWIGELLVYNAAWYRNINVSYEEGRKVAGSISAGFTGFFIDIKSYRSHYGPGVDTVSSRIEYQEHFLGVKGAGA